MIDLDGGADSGETTRYNDSLTLLAHGKIQRENSMVFITPNKLATKQARQPAINYPRQAGEAGIVACTIDCKEAALPVQVEILAVASTDLALLFK